ncbi:MAG TPA: phosphoglycerate kinase [Euryarchaeota archaeon]|nr:phosphoglycerate kinase [Euryarchaeota archaeon]
MPAFNTLDDIDVSGKKILLRVDINSPLERETLEIKDDVKIASALPTVRELAEKNARVAILAHQGRKDQWDFRDLSPHADILSDLLGREVRYIDDLIGEKAKSAIRSLADGEMILLANLRTLDEESAKLSSDAHADSQLVRTLSPLFDLFVNDAFASSHRRHASCVGFPMVLPSAAGRLMEREIGTLEKITESPERPCVFVFGGYKFADAIPVIQNLMLRDIADRILLGGLIGLAFLASEGHDIGPENVRSLRDELTEENMGAARDIIADYGESVVLPVDMALDADGERERWDVESGPAEFPSLDIGDRTIELFGKLLSEAKTVLISGPVGVFEREQFAKGTYSVFDKSVSSGAFSIIGGGHTTAAAKQMGFAEKISYSSTGGGALERYLTGKPLPAVEALIVSALRHKFIEP